MPVAPAGQRACLLGVASGCYLLPSSNRQLLRGGWSATGSLGPLQAARRRRRRARSWVRVAESRRSWIS